MDLTTHSSMYRPAIRGHMAVVSVTVLRHQTEHLELSLFSMYEGDHQKRVHLVTSRCKPLEPNNL